MISLDLSGKRIHFDLCFLRLPRPGANLGYFGFCLNSLFEAVPKTARLLRPQPFRSVTEQVFFMKKDTKARTKMGWLCDAAKIGL